MRFGVKTTTEKMEDGSEIIKKEGVNDNKVVYTVKSYEESRLVTSDTEIARKFMDLMAKRRAGEITGYGIVCKYDPKRDAIRQVILKYDLPKNS